ncbi:helix-turn-helix domain-containing protein [Kaistia terrae]|uniref:Helix-turn-helix domain-containing protein n=1 Tax=Kaistia terrae TaxID=537017 RepID=A0ABW0Q456_9HYPH|nr:helix-turn-helix domain-containing protein [Kaistia terrae]MCX5581348.1 helix-turn-helix domain-containing protein [Kaistia terrae]
MNTLLYIRKNVLGITQAEMAEIAGVRQATVSRWENGALLPDLSQLAMVRKAAIAKGVAWQDAWFFERPVAGSEAA